MTKQTRTRSKAQIKTYRRMSHRLRATASGPRRMDYRYVERIRIAAHEFERLGKSGLAGKYAELRRRTQAGTSPLASEVFVPCLALALEAVRRTMGMVYYDVQLLAGMALATGAITEMKTGEGKTIVAALPCCLHGLTGEGVHVATVNSYLARRDFEAIRHPLELLGLTVGLSIDAASVEEKRAAYACDVTYSTGYELGFDFLRDQANLRTRRQPLLGESFRHTLRQVGRNETPMVQRGHSFAIVDEVDSVLIDEANTPLVLSSTRDGNESSTLHELAASVARRMQHLDDYYHDRRRRTLRLTSHGLRRIYDDPEGIPESGLCRPWSIYVEQALRAEHLYDRDAHYVVENDKILIVDQTTGRIFADRSWQDGLHQAVECKENVPISHEKESIARVSRQRYFGLYKTLCGMSGTCTGHEREMLEFYDLPVVVIPERKVSQRKNLPTRYFSTNQAKWDAIVEDIQRRNQTGQPILVGTRTIGESQMLSKLLSEKSVPHKLLNGRQDEEEAAIVASAGAPAAVTIATNMAGRGTDISISEEVAQWGGLHVVATERQESIRVDRQLIGRTARQGAAGSCQFFVSAEDELFAKHGIRQARQISQACERGHDDSRRLDRLTDHVQSQAERLTYEQRSELVQQDKWLNSVLVTVAETSPESMKTYAS